MEPPASLPTSPAQSFSPFNLATALQKHYYALEALAMDREDVEDFKDIYDPQNEENTSEAQREAAQAGREVLFPAGFDPALAASGKSAGAKRGAGGRGGESAAKRAAVVAGVDDAAFKAKYDANQVGDLALLCKHLL